MKHFKGTAVVEGITLKIDNNSKLQQIEMKLDTNEVTAEDIGELLACSSERAETMFLTPFDSSRFAWLGAAVKEVVLHNTLKQIAARVETYEPDDLTEAGEIKSWSGESVPLNDCKVTNIKLRTGGSKAGATFALITGMLPDHSLGVVTTQLKRRIRLTLDSPQEELELNEQS